MDGCESNNVPNLTSSPSETWTEQQVVGDYIIFSAIAHSTTQYVASCAVNEPNAFGPFSITNFRGTFNGFGSNILTAPGSSQSGTDAINLNVQQGSIVYEGVLLYNNNQSPSNCPTITQNNGQIQRYNNCIANLNSVAGAQFNTGPVPGTGTTTLTVSWSGCTGGSSTGCQIIRHSVLELQGPAVNQPAGTTTVCYGVCGNPSVTLVNPNATHPVNFNVSQTIFYIAQSQVNGFVQNVTTNLGKSYTNGVIVTLGIYVIQSCPLNNAPFTVQCPGVLQTSVGFTNPSKGRLTIPLQTPVSISSWIGIAVSSTVSGLDLNETNGTCGSTGGTNCASPPGMVTSTGTMPSAITAYNSLNVASISTTGLWAFITGNINPGNPTPIPSTNTGCINSDLVCFEVASICGLTPSNCMVGGLVYMFGYFLILVTVMNLGLWWLKRETDIEGSIHPATYPMLLLFLSYFMWGIGIFPIQIIIVETALIILGLVGVVRAHTGIGED